MKSTVSEKGQITIPKAIRDSLGLQPGTRLEFEERGGCLVAYRADTVNPVDAVIGILSHRDTDELLRELRGPDWDPRTDPPTLHGPAR